MGNSAVCCVDRQRQPEQGVFASYIKAQYEVYQGSKPRKSEICQGGKLSKSKSCPNPLVPHVLDTVQPEVRYWEDFSEADAEKLSVILDSWGSVAFLLNMYFFDVAATEHGAGMPHGRISLNGLSEVLKKFYSNLQISISTVSPEVWRAVGIKYEEVVPRFINHQKASTLIRLFTKDVGIRLSGNTYAQPVVSDQGAKVAENASDPDVTDQAVSRSCSKIVGQGEAQEAKKTLSNLPSPSRRSQRKVPMLDLTNL